MANMQEPAVNLSLLYNVSTFPITLTVLQYSAPGKDLQTNKMVNNFIMQDLIHMSYPTHTCLAN